MFYNNIEEEAFFLYKIEGMLATEVEEEERGKEFWERELMKEKHV